MAKLEHRHVRSGDVTRVGLRSYLPLFAKNVLVWAGLNLADVSSKTGLYLCSNPRAHQVSSTVLRARRGDYASSVI